MLGTEWPAGCKLTWGKWEAGELTGGDAEDVSSGL